MKIVFVLAGLGFGGAERVVSILANQFTDAHDVRIILTSGNDSTVYPLDDRISICILPKEYSNFKRWKMFRRLCQAFQADVVLAFMDTISIMASVFLAFTGIPVIASERNDPSEKSRKLSIPFRVLKWFSKFLTAGYVFQSEGAKACYPMMAQKKSCIILNPLNTAELPKRQSCIENTIVSVGRLHPQKNHKMLIKAFASSMFCKEHTLHIYGEGPLKSELEAYSRFLGMEGRVFLEGNRSNVLDCIKNAKLFVLTSNYEGLPNALMEAMAIGLPCISTDCSPGGVRMLISQNFDNGLIVPCGDEDQLVRVLDDLYFNQERLSEMGRKATTIRERTGVDIIAREWLRFIAVCTNNRHSDVV